MAALNVSPGQQNSDLTKIHSGEESNSSPIYWNLDIYHHSSSPSIIVKTRSGITPNNNQVNWIYIYLKGCNPAFMDPWHFAEKLQGF